MIKYEDIRFGVLQVLLLGALSGKNQTTIVQIGAHDGKYYDSLFEVLERFKPNTKLFLIEPQESMHAQLSNHYNWHPDYTIIQEVVKDGAVYDFYSISPKYYQDYRYEFVDIQMPDYVNPTGISTCSYKTFRKHYDNYFLNKEVSFEEATIVKKVETITLPNLMLKYGIDFTSEILIIDAEGDDANILHHNNWELWKPKIIIFEQMHLDTLEKTKIINLLEKQQYLCLDLVEHMAALFLG